MENIEYKLDGFSRYVFNNLGEVYNEKSKNKNSYYIKNGYKLYNILDDNNKQRCITLHKIVYKAYNKDYDIFQKYKYKMVIDHKDSNKLNNDISNLNEISCRDNILKERNINRKYPTGIRYRDGKYTAYKNINRKQYHIGTFDSLDIAVEKLNEWVKK